jgi:hypothetical protein
MPLMRRESISFFTSGTNKIDSSVDNASTSEFLTGTVRPFVDPAGHLGINGLAHSETRDNCFQIGE